MKFYQIGLVALSVFTFSGCMGQPSIAKIDEAEAFKYIKQSEAEYEKIKSSVSNEKMHAKWIQAANKTEPCKLYVGYSPNDDRTLKDDYKIFWDGKCKDGYAYGLGRELERGLLTSLDAIAIYSGGKNEPEYFVQKDNLAHATIEGDLKNDNVVVTTIIDDGLKFHIEYRYGHFGSHKNAGIDFVTTISPFYDAKQYVKKYPNFYYEIPDWSNDEFSRIGYIFGQFDAKYKPFGYGFQITKQGIIEAGEKFNGSLMRRVQLPKSFIDNANSILNEIKNAGQVAINAQQKALMVKQQYKDTICKDSVKVSFMDNKEYKAICRENEEAATLKQKIDKKLAEIEKQKQAKRQQQNDQRLIQAREAEANAAQKQAAAAQDAVFWNNLNQQNTNFQLQQLNNRLMLQNLGVKY
ncbi:MAG: hypothetical protein PHE67_05575 [Campylobacterales bacterium]|nr:hypothetical protein [Campylobacterales bacterium]